MCLQISTEQQVEDSESRIAIEKCKLFGARELDFDHTILIS